MKKIIKIIGIIMILIFLVQTIFAAEISIDMKDSFGLGEKIFFNYSISGESKEITYMPYIYCPNAPLYFLEEKTGKIPLNDTYNYLTVNEDIESQKCNASVSIIKPYKLNKIKTFEIITNPSFEFNIKSCKDISCSEQSKVFVEGKSIYLDYSSDISELIIEGILNYPDGKTEEINLPYDFKTEQIGTYNLEVSASREGYKTAIAYEQFGVIKSEAKIEYTSVEDINSGIKEVENINDSKIEKSIDEEADNIKGDDKKNYTFIIILSAIIILIIGILIYYLISRKNQNSL